MIRPMELLEAALMAKSIEEILPPKPDARLRLYCYVIDDAHHEGLIKVGQTTRDVKKRIEEQTKTAGIKPTILWTSLPSARTARPSPTIRCGHASLPRASRT